MHIHEIVNSFPLTGGYKGRLAITMLGPNSVSSWPCLSVLWQEVPRPKQSTGVEVLGVVLLGRDTQKEELQVTVLSLYSPISLGFETIQAGYRSLSRVLCVMGPASYVNPVSLCFQL